MKFFRVGDDRRFVLSVIFSLLTIMGGIFWTFRVGQLANHYAHRLGHLEDGLKDMHRLVARAEVGK
jgi:hypothetical protein